MHILKFQDPSSYNFYKLCSQFVSNKYGLNYQQKRERKKANLFPLLSKSFDINHRCFSKLAIFVLLRDLTMYLKSFNYEKGK